MHTKRNDSRCSGLRSPSASSGNLKLPVFHRFDGDGMLHAVRIRNGRVSYSNSYVQTTRLTKERAAGRSLFSKVCAGTLILSTELSPIKVIQFGAAWPAAWQGCHAGRSLVACPLTQLAE